MYTCHNRHKYYLKCHLIFVCKYRKRLLDGDMQKIIKDIFSDIEKVSDFLLKSWRQTKTISTCWYHIHRAFQSLQ